MEIARHVLRFKRQRTPDLRVPAVEYAASRQDPDHGVRLAVKKDRPPDQIRIGAELRFPERVTENGDTLVTRAGPRRRRRFCQSRP